VGERPHPPLAHPGHLLPGDHGQDAGQGLRLGRVDRDDPGVRVRAPEKGDVRHPWERDVVREDASSGLEAGGLPSHHALADIPFGREDRDRGGAFLGAHRAPPERAAPAFLAARTMA